MLLVPKSGQRYDEDEKVKVTRGKEGTQTTDQGDPLYISTSIEQTEKKQ